MKELKYAYIPAATAFILSFGTGVLFGVGLLTALFRGLLFGVAFGAGGFGIRMILERFLPEFFEGADSGDQESSSDYEEEPVTATTSDEENPAVDIVVESDDEETASLYRENQDEGDAGEFEELEADSLSDTVTDDSNDDIVEESEEAEEVEELEEVSNGKLPDLDSFSDAFESVALDREGQTASGSESKHMEVDLMGTQHDPSEVVKAIRTFMKKDQEG
jgi:hypothetical protein